MQGMNVRNLVLKQLLFELNEQYEKQTLEINQSLRNATEQIFGHQSQLKFQISEEQKKQIQDDLTLFMFAFTKAPTAWVQLLRNDQISTRTTEIIINRTDTLTKIYKQIVKQTNHLITENKAKIKGVQTPDHETQYNINNAQQFDFQNKYMTQATKTMMAQLLNNLAQQICSFFKQGKKLIEDEAKAIEQKIKGSQIMNPYFLFAMLKQMSTYTYFKIEENMSIFFHNLSAETIKNFCRYVQKNYEFVQLSCQQLIPKIYTQEQEKQNIEKQNKYWLDYLKSLSDEQTVLKKVTSAQGETGVMVIKSKINKQKKPKQDKQDKLDKEEDTDSDNDDFNDAEKLIFKIGQDNKITVTNTRTSQRRWEIFNMKDSVSGLYKILKQEITQQTGGKIQKQIIAYGVPLGQYANLGGSVGRCLADINKYKSANGFLKDLSISTAIGGSMTFILAQVPILSYFVIAGGLTFTFYHTLNNKATSKKKKLKQFGKTSVTAVGSVGSAVAGMMIGQTLIPVPFLGAFIGGVIGGFLGQTGSNVMTKLMNKESYRNLINYLKEDVEKNHWNYTPKLLQKLGIDRQYFENAVCQKVGRQDAFITAICFCVVSTYETKRYIKRNQQKMKQLQLQKQQQKNLVHLNDEQQFDTQFDIVGITEYLTKYDVILLHQHDKLQKCIKHLNI